MSIDKLKNGMLRILFANVFNMIFSIGTNLMLPHFLSVDSYAQIKTYQLYVSYVAVFNLGYNDGMYLQFGGKSLDCISNNQLAKSISTLRVFQFVITICTVVGAFFTKNFTLIAAAITIFPQNIISYYKNLFQAVGEFGKYSVIMNYSTGLTFGMNIMILLLLGNKQYQVFIIGYIFISFFLWIMLELSMNKRKKLPFFSAFFSLRKCCENVVSGIFLLVANLSSIMLTSIDRWFIKILMSSYQFAQYSFAVSMENFLSIAVSPITLTLYNYFCIHKSEEEILEIRDIILAFATIIVIVAFPVKFLIELFLIKYKDSICVVFILFASQIFYILIRSLYCNMYKSEKRQKLYFLRMCIVISSAFMLNIVCFHLHREKESFAVGTLLSAILWFFLCQSDYKQIVFSFRHYFYIIVEVCIFIYMGIYVNPILGAFLYLCITCIMLRLFMPSAFKRVVGLVVNQLNTNFKFKD